MPQMGNQDSEGQNEPTIAPTPSLASTLSHVTEITSVYVHCLLIRDMQ